MIKPPSCSGNNTEKQTDTELGDIRLHQDIVIPLGSLGDVEKSLIEGQPEKGCTETNHHNHSKEQIDSQILMTIPAQ